MNLISSWSGGKDSCLACYKAIESGYRVSYLLTKLLHFLVRA
jgi:diphthamide synthase (EF-2-diphthine--ammonia ligase)